MEQDQNTKKAYLQLLIDTMEKKTAVLRRLVEITGIQDALMEPESFDDDQFMHTISLKEEQLYELETLDKGFDRIFELMKEELIGNKFRYEAEIQTLQGYIVVITDMGVQLQAMELRNKAKLEVLFANKRGELRRSRVNTQTVAKYYRNVASQTGSEAYFYDKKK